MTHLTFRLAGAPWAIPVHEIGAIGEDREVRALPRAARAVRGLAVWSGAVVTVVDLALLLGEEAGEGGPTLVRLAAPREHTAFWIPARVTASAGDLEPGVRRVDPAELLAGAVSR